MSLSMKVPAVGESIAEVTVATWLKKDGDHVSLDEVLCELESEKATFELPAEKAGILRIRAQEGDVLEIGAVICEIEEGDATSEQPVDKTADSKAMPPVTAPVTTGEVREMIVPAVGESITEVSISSWLKNEGDFVALDDIIAEVESEKATFELPAEANGILRQVAKEGDVLEIGAVICRIEVMDGQPAPAEAAHTPATSAAEAETGSYASGHPSPAAGKILSEKNISPAAVKGTGVGGRITKEDALRAEKKAEVQKQAPGVSVQPPAVSGNRQETRKKLSNLRKTIAKRLVSVKNDTAMLTTFNEVNMKPIMDVRKKYKELFKDKYEVGLGFMSFFTKACCQALQEWPAVNAMIDNDEVVYRDFCDVSIAVSTPRGLVVPVIRNAESMDFKDIEKEIIHLATKARDGKLTIDEMTGGTFTITNGGVFGSMLSTPIINAPQSAILGMHNIVERPVVENGEVVVRPIMYLALSYDHRIIDGRESVSFLVRVKQLLEDPARLLLGV
ncbi:MAG: 2-oxoglutarate dehydrogenase complex dihydrolipoyllysine-residue succinyltransferase [Cyclobacteriaceae bacterium]|nr:2-oxoglutarate dehydrogenase complex dihydrolipoyllysine-residue succinyltransferase [Cyclobacteriaceae bacterium]